MKIKPIFAWATLCTDPDLCLPSKLRQLDGEYIFPTKSYAKACAGINHEVIIKVRISAVKVKRKKIK